jgi:4-hydroxy-tetrahydrodipicolinate reductase
MTAMKVAVIGSRGRMGAEVCRAVEAAEDLELVAAVDAGDDRCGVETADVVVEFTVPDAAMGNIEWCIDHGLDVVVGTTGFDDAKIAQVGRWLEGRSSRVLIASNYSIAAILMMEFARQAAPYFESVEIIEAHHPNKVDAPSGTAATTARKIALARSAAGLGAVPDATTTDPQGARGAQIDGIHVHAIRQRGLFANQEVRFGNPGEALNLVCNSFDRGSYMPGVLTAVRAIKGLAGLTLGIEALLGIGE